MLWRFVRRPAPKVHHCSNRTETVQFGLANLFHSDKQNERHEKQRGCLWNVPLVEASRRGATRQLDGIFPPWTPFGPVFCIRRRT